MEYKQLKTRKILNRNVYIRYAGWQGVINAIPYILIRRNPLRNDWVDFAIECGWLVWAAGIRVEPID